MVTTHSRLLMAAVCAVAGAILSAQGRGPVELATAPVPPGAIRIT
jgi:hypothetical protein